MSFPIICFEMSNSIHYANVPDFKIPLVKKIKGNKIYYGTHIPENLSEFDIVILNNDVSNILSKLESNFIRLVVSSPPYNIGKPYEKRKKFQDYIKWQEMTIGECIRMLSDNGSICWEVGNYVKNGEIFPLDLYFYSIFKKNQLKLRNRIIWRFGHGLHARKRFSGRYEVILWFTKSDKYIFNLDNVRVKQKYPGKKGYKPHNKNKYTSHPKGKNPSDVWDLSEFPIIREEWQESIWDIPNVKANHPEKTIHPAQFPIELVERLVLALTNPGDWLFDPFMGVGSSLIAAYLHSRKAIGIDKEKKYCDIAYQRIIDAINGSLKRRRLGTPIYKPSGNLSILKRKD